MNNVTMYYTCVGIKIPELVLVFFKELVLVFVLVFMYQKELVLVLVPKKLALLVFKLEKFRIY